MSNRDIELKLMLKDLLSAEMKKATNEVVKNTGRIKKENEGLKASFSGVGSAVGAVKIAMTAIAGSAIIRSFISAASEVENLEASFKTLLGTQEKAVAMVAKLRQESATTPLQLTDLARGSKTLLAFGIEAEKLIPTMRMLGDISLGDKERFNSLSLAFGQMSSAGRLMGQDLLQMINAGFNPLQVISEKTGESMLELKNKMSKGQISVNQVTDAFRSATSEGGKLFKGMETASKTLSGRFSTLKDQISLAMVEVMDGGAFYQLKSTLADISKSVGEMLSSGAFKKIGAEVSRLFRGFSMLKSIGDALLVTIWEIINQGFAPMVEAMKLLFKAGETLGKSWELLFKGNFDEILDIQDNFVDDVKKTFDSLVDDAIGSNDNIKKSWNTAVEEMTATYNKFISDKINAEQGASQTSIKTAENTAEGVTKTYKQMNIVFKQEMGSSLEKIQSGFEDVLEEGFKGFQEEQKNMSSNILKFQDTFTNSFLEMDKGIQGVFNNIATGFKEMLAQMAAKAAAFGLLTLLTGGAASPLISAGGGSFGSALLGNLGFRANGGPVSSGGSFVVGERGPELFKPDTAGTIRPSQATNVVNHISYSPVNTINASTFGDINQMIDRDPQGFMDKFNDLQRRGFEAKLA